MSNMTMMKKELLQMFELGKLTKRVYIQVAPSNGTVYASDEGICSLAQVEYEAGCEYPNLAMSGINTLSYKATDISAFMKNTPDFVENPAYFVGPYGIGIMKTGRPIYIMENLYAIDNAINMKKLHTYQYISRHTRCSYANNPQVTDPLMFERLKLKKDEGAKFHMATTDNGNVFLLTLFGGLIPVTAKDTVRYEIYDMPTSIDCMTVFTVARNPGKDKSRGNIMLRYYIANRKV